MTPPPNVFEKFKEARQKEQEHQAQEMAASEEQPDEDTAEDATQIPDPRKGFRHMHRVDEEPEFPARTSHQVWIECNPEFEPRKRPDVTVVLPVFGHEKPMIQDGLEQWYHVQVQREDGLAHAIHCGIQAAETDLVVIMDSDGDHPIWYIPKMLHDLDNYGHHMVIGCRTLWRKGKKGTASRLGNAYIRWRLGLPFHDCTSGYLVAPREKLLGLPSEIWEGYGDYFFDLLAEAQYAQWDIGVVDIEYAPDHGGPSHTKLWDHSWQYIARVRTINRRLKARSSPVETPPAKPKRGRKPKAKPDDEGIDIEGLPKKRGRKKPSDPIETPKPKKRTWHDIL